MTFCRMQIQTSVESMLALRDSGTLFGHLLLFVQHFCDLCYCRHFSVIYIQFLLIKKTFVSTLLALAGKIVLSSLLCTVVSTVLSVVCTQTTCMCVFREAKLADTYFDREVEQAFITASKAIYQQKTLPYLLIAQRVGNMYTSSLYGGLVSYLFRSVFVLFVIP